MSSSGSSCSNSKGTKKDVKKKEKGYAEECIWMLIKGNAHLIDLEAAVADFSLKPYLGDRLQYELHNYCKKDNVKSNTQLVVRLSELCYSEGSVSQFRNMERFVGCVCYITSYLLKKEVYESALGIIDKLSIKKQEILKALHVNSDIRLFLCNINSNFMATAALLASKLQSKKDSKYKVSHRLALSAVKCLQLCTDDKFQVAKIMMKRAKIYFHTIKHFQDEDVAEFYKTLKDVLKTLIPDSELDCLLFFLSKVDLIKDVDFSNGLEIQSQLKRIVHMVSVMTCMSPDRKFMLDWIVDFFFSTKGDWAGNWCIKEDKKNVFESQLYFLLVCNIFNYGMQFWWKKYEDNWSEHSADSIRIICRNFLDLYNSHYSNLSLYCSSTKSPFEVCFADLLTGNLHKVQYTIRLCLKHKIPRSLSLVTFSQEAFKMSMKCVEVMTKKDCCDVLRNYAWKQSVIHQTNLVLDIQKQPTETECWTSLSVCCEEVLQTVVNAEYEPPFDLHHIHILFQRWHYANIKLKKYLEAFYVCTAYYICYPEQETEITSLWLLTKSELSDETYEDTLMCDILKSSDSQLRNFKKSYLKTQIDTKALLMMELKIYSFCPSSTFQNPNTPYKLVTKIWEQLQSFDLEPWETSFALECLVFTKISGDEEELPKSLIDKCNEVAETLLKKEHKGKKCQSILHAANLNFFLFLYDMKQVERSGGMMESSQLILNYLKKEQEEKVKFGEDLDLNLTLNVMPSSSQLTVELETNYLNALNRVVELWEEAVKQGKDELPTRFEFEIWIHTVKQAAYLYELIGEYQRAATTWVLLYRIGKLREDPGTILTGLTHLLDNFNDVETSNLFKEAETISDKLDTEKDILIPFWLTVASNHLKNKHSAKCLEYLLRAKKALDCLKSTIKTHILYARFWCLVSQFLVVHPEYETDFGYPKGTNLRVMVFRAFKYTNIGGQSDYVKTATHEDSVELVLAMLEVNIWAYYFFGAYRETEHMRLFLGSLYQIVQKLFLPTRTAEILVRLAEVDILCEKTSDCEEKVLKLKSILTTLPAKCDGIIKKKDASPYLTVSPKMDGKIPRPTSPFLEELVVRREADPSPVHYYLPDVTPSRSRQHGKTCKCRPCQNILVQILTMNTLSVEGEMYKLGRVVQNAVACYEEAYKTMDRLQLLRAEQSESLGTIASVPFKTDPGALGFRLRFVQFHSVRFLMKHALFELCKPKPVTSHVWETIHYIGSIMKQFSFEEKLFMWTFEEVKLCAVAFEKKDKAPKKKPLLDITSPNIAKTPAPKTFLTAKKAAKENQKLPLSVAVDKNVIVVGSSCSSSDKRNKAFIVEENLTTARKANIRPKKLVFKEPETVKKTAKKAPSVNGSVVKPRKLDLDAAEASDKKKVLRKRVTKK